MLIMSSMCLRIQSMLFVYQNKTRAKEQERKKIKVFKIIKEKVKDNENILKFKYC